MSWMRPEHLMSYSSSKFISKEVTSICKCFNITELEGSPHHPQANDKVEKFIYFFKRLKETKET
jgi:transposase InsO family protein